MEGGKKLQRKRKRPLSHLPKMEDNFKSEKTAHTSGVKVDLRNSRILQNFEPERKQAGAELCQAQY